MDTILLSKVGSVPTRNVCRSKDLHDIKSLPPLASELSPGYNPALGVPTIEKLDKEGRAEALAELEAEEAWIHSLSEPINVFDKTVGENGEKVRVTPENLLKAFETRHKVDGKLVAPEYGFITANRRGKAMNIRNAALLTLGKEPVMEWPCTLVKYENALERGVACLAGNMSIDNGRLRVSVVDLIMTTMRLIAIGGIEADLVKAGVKRGTAQKLVSLVNLNNKFKDLKLVEKVCNGDIDWGPLNKDTMRVLYQGQVETKTKEAKEPGTKAEVEEYFNNPGDKKNAPKILSKPKMDAIINANPVEIICEVVFSIRHNHPENLSKFVDHADEINALTRKLGLTGGATSGEADDSTADEG